MKTVKFKTHSEMVKFFKTNKFNSIYFLVASLPEHKFRVEQKEILDECNLYSNNGQYDIEGNDNKINISFEYDIGGDCIELHK